VSDQVAGKEKNRKGVLLLGLLLLATGCILVLNPRRSVALEWLMRLWPLFLLCAGMFRVMGFAINRRPKSPTGGLFLLAIGVLFLAARFHSNLNVLQIYGRYWIVLLAVFGAVELIRYYSHRPGEGPPPRLFSIWRLVVVALFVVSGVIANRVATSNPSLLSAVRLPEYMSELRDSFIGQSYSFQDEPFEQPTDEPLGSIKILNRYGNVKVTGGADKVRASLTKGIRAWSEDDARKIADQIKLVVNRTPAGLEIGTNRDEVGQQFTTDLEVQVPGSLPIQITDSYGGISVSGASGGLTISASFGNVEVASAAGRVEIALTHSDAIVSRLEGDLVITGAKGVRINGVTGSVDVAASNGSVDLDGVAGPVNVDAPYSRINAARMSDAASLRTEHGNIIVSRSAGVNIEAPFSDLTVEEIKGDLRANTSHGSVKLRSVRGDVEIQAQLSSIDAEDLFGTASLETSNGQVTVKRFADSLRIRTSYRDVTIATDRSVPGDIDVESSHGEIRMLVPPSSQFKLDAVSTEGQIRTVGFAGLSQRQRERLSATLGSDGPLVRLKTSFRNIVVQARGPRQTQAAQVVN
jgi:DUF4097 and DUF4098 domain-containing protein YvlB/uncharacterized membrane protein HdeD (DUF308 family)